MTAKLCHGEPLDTQRLKKSNAYCEGREAAAAGALVGTNPHPAGSEDATVWTAGFDSWAADPTGVTVVDCCASEYGGGHVP
jgi:hypothetical protein